MNSDVKTYAGSINCFAEGRVLGNNLKPFFCFVFFFLFQSSFKIIVFLYCRQKNEIQQLPRLLRRKGDVNQASRLMYGSLSLK